MDLILWRHAEAEDAADGRPDAKRRLTARGDKQARQIARWLAERLPKRTVVLVSPTERTQQTAHALGLPFEIGGFMLSRSYFEAIGPFPPGPSMLAETSLADRILASGEWLLFPDEIRTSARRFETEGLRERQTLNALITGAAAAGWDRFFAEVPRLYREQGQSGRLRLGPILQRIDGLLAELSPAERRLLWRAVGAYVRDNAWQVPFFFDLRRALALDPGERQPATPLTALFERWLAPLLAGPGGARLGSLLTRLWLGRLLRRETAAGGKGC